MARHHLHPESLELSIIIPAYNEAKLLPETIKRLREAMNSMVDTDWELIVCDNNSSDETSEIARELGARVVFEPDNQISKARNRGAELANGEWLLFVDADTYPSAALMEEVFDLIHTDEKIGSGVTVSVQDGSLLNKLRMERLNPLFRLFNISGGAFLLSRKTGFDAIGGFSQGLYAYEEFDFIWRLKKYGRSEGQKFQVFYQHPVITSGRKGELTFPSLIQMILSNFFAVGLLVLYYILPRFWVRKMGKNLLSFWYRER